MEGQSDNTDMVQQQPEMETTYHVVSVAQLDHTDVVQQQPDTETTANQVVTAAQSDNADVVQQQPNTEMTTNQVVTAAQSDNADMVHQQPDTDTTTNQVVSAASSANVSVTTIPDTSLDESLDPNDEPQIEVPLLSDSGQRTFKVTVSLSDFCKLPVSAIINSETNKKLSPTDNHDLQLDMSYIRAPDKLSLHEKDDLNSHSSLIQMPGANSGDGVACKSSQNSEEPLLVCRTSASLLTQVGIDKSGMVCTDFPFDGNTLSLKEKRALLGNTLLPPKKRLVNSSGDTCTSGEPSHIFRQTFAEMLAKDLVSMAVGSDYNENDNNYNASAELYSDASKQLVTSNPSEGPTTGSKLFLIDTTQFREMFPEDTSKDTSTGIDNKNITQVNISLNNGNTLEDPADEETSQDVNTTVGDSKQDASNEKTAVGGDSK